MLCTGRILHITSLAYNVNIWPSRRVTLYASSTVARLGVIHETTLYAWRPFLVHGTRLMFQMSRKKIAIWTKKCWKDPKREWRSSTRNPVPEVSPIPEIRNPEVGMGQGKSHRARSLLVDRRPQRNGVLRPSGNNGTNRAKSSGRLLFLTTCRSDLFFLFVAFLIHCTKSVPVFVYHSRTSFSGN